MDYSPKGSKTQVQTSLAQLNKAPTRFLQSQKDGFWITPKLTDIRIAVNSPRGKGLQMPRKRPIRHLSHGCLDKFVLESGLLAPAVITHLFAAHIRPSMVRALCVHATTALVIDIIRVLTLVPLSVLDLVDNHSHCTTHSREFQALLPRHARPIHKGVTPKLLRGLVVMPPLGAMIITH